MDDKFGKLFSDFLTAGIATADVEKTRRVKVLNSFLLTLLIFSPLLGLFFWSLNIKSLFYVSCAAGSFALLDIILLRVSRNIILVSNIGILIFWLFSMFIRWYTGAMSVGGILVLQWVWNAAMILLAIFFTGYLWGTIWSCLVFIETGVAAFLYKTGHHFGQVIPDQLVPAYGLGAYLLCLLTMLLIAFLFEKERQEVLERESLRAQVIRDSKKYIDDILRRCPIPTFIVDKYHRVVEWNKACEEITGIPPEKIIGKRVWEGLAIDHDGSFADKLIDNPYSFADQHSDMIVSQSDSGSYALEAYLPYLRGGLKALISTAPILDKDGSVKGAIQCIQEIQTAKHTETGESRPVETLLNDLPQPAFMVDRKGKIRAWNYASEKRFGYSADMMLGKSPSALVSKSYRASFRESVIQVLKGKSMPAREWKYYNIDGEPVYVRAELYPSKSYSGTIEGCVIINTDITDLKLKLRILQQTLAKNKEKLKALSEEYDLLKRNIASFIRRKDGADSENSLD